MSEFRPSYQKALTSFLTGEAGVIAAEPVAHAVREAGLEPSEVLRIHLELSRELSDEDQRRAAGFLGHFLACLEKTPSAPPDPTFFLDSVPAQLWQGDARGARFRFNQAWLAFCGREAAAESGFGWQEFIHPDDAMNVATEIEDAVANGLPFKLEYRVRRQDGIYRWLLDQGRPAEGRPAEGRPANVSNSRSSLMYSGSRLDITDRKVIERGLEAHRRKMTNIFQTAVEAIITSDEDGIIHDFNAAAERMFGYTADEILGKNVTLLMPPRYIPAHSAAMAEFHDRRGMSMVIGSGRELTALDRLGREFPIYLSLSQVMIENRRLFTAFVHDITQRRQIEDKLRNSELLYRSVVEDQEEFILRFQADGPLVFVNGAFCRFWKKSEAELLGTHPSCYIRPSETELMHERMEEVCLEKPSFSITSRFEREGETYWHLWKFRAVFDEEGQVSEFQGIGRDITDRKAAELALQRSNLLYRTLVSSLPGIDVFLFDRDLRFSLVDGKLVRKLGFEPDDLVGRRLADLLPPDLVGPMTQICKQALQGETEMISFRLDDSWYTFQGASVPDLGGGINMGLAVGRDITEQHGFELQLKLAKEKAEAASRAKSEFLANMSHEIRTPLNAVIGFAGLLAQELTDVKHVKYINTIESSGKTLLNLINDILDLSKIESGRMDVIEEPLNLTALLEDIRNMFWAKFQEKNLDFRLVVGHPFPEQVYLDGLKIRQILLNLVGNALKFTSEGYVVLRAAAFPGGEEGRARMEFSVEDTGIGISEKDQARTFDAFVQVDQRDSRHYGGTGLGLSICRKLVEMMGGQITVDSEVGEGSTFTVVMPRVRIIRGAQPNTAGEDQALIRFEGRVLVVDDIPDNREVLRLLLEDWGVEVSEAESGEEALTACRKIHYDLVLMDLRMDGMDGFEAVKRIKSANQQTVIAVTASVLDETRRRVRYAGFDDFLQKPLEFGEVRRCLARHLKIRNQEEGQGSLGTSGRDPAALDVFFVPLSLYERGLACAKSRNFNQIRDFAESLAGYAQESGETTAQQLAVRIGDAATHFDIRAISELFQTFKNLGKPTPRNSGEAIHD